MKVRVVEYETVGSTNDLLMGLARRGAREGLVVKAEFQRHGRGQGSRRWYSPRRKGLLVSMLLRPRRDISKTPHLALLTCQVVRETLEPYMDGVTLKLPNDILVKGRKIGGVLVEGQAKGRRQLWACVGLGLNVHTGGKQVFRGGTSAYIEIGRKIGINDLLSRFISNFTRRYSKIR